MAEFDINRYKNPTIEDIHNPSVIQGKLEELVDLFLPEAREQIDRCFYLGFETAYNALRNSPEGKFEIVVYFTENSTELRSHIVSYFLFRTSTMYASSLGQLAREHKLDDEQSEKIIETAKSVFSHAKVGPLPDLHRPDIEHLFNTLNSNMPSNNPFTS